MRLRNAGGALTTGLVGCALAFAGAAHAAPVGTITELTAGLPAGAAPAAIVAGPDGNLWFNIEGSTRAVGRITPSGTITSFTAGLLPGSHPRWIALGPDGNLWFTDTGTTHAIGQITPSGTVAEFTAGLNSGSKPVSIVLGPDGNLWFTDNGTSPAIGRITPAGAITEFSAGLGAGSQPQEISAGPDGNVWFTDTGTTPAIGRITPSGAITEFSAGLPAHGEPYGIASGPGGNLWFADIGVAAIGDITPAGAITEFPAGLSGAYPDAIAPGPDGNMWFATTGKLPVIGQITSTGVVTEYSTGLSRNSFPVSIAPGPDGNMWFGDEGETDAVGQVSTGAPPALTSAPAVQGGPAEAQATCAAGAWATWAGLQPSTSLFGFDGYRWLIGGTQVATGQTYTPSTASIGQPLECELTVTYPSLDVTTAATSAPVTVVVPEPALTALRQSASRWRDGSRLASIGRRARKPPVGTSFSFSLNTPATLSFSFLRQGRGRSVAHRCVAETRKNARRRACSLSTSAGAFHLAAQAGAASVRFQGKVSRRTALRPGRYTLTLTATNSTGTSAPQSLSFTVAGS
jgi:streptogramin lyase